MTENSGEQESAPLEHKDKDNKKKKGEKSKMKKTRRQFREEAQRAQTQEAPQERPNTGRDEPVGLENATSLSPSAIVEMFHQQDEETTPSTLVAITARYLVENETSGDFYQVRTRQRKHHAYFSDHTRHRRSSLQRKVRDESTKADNAMCWNIFQRDGEKAVVVMLLGIVNGICWMDAMNIHSGNISSARKEVDNFACAYSAGSNRSRQNLFILFKYPSPRITILDHYCRLIRKLSRVNPYHKYKTLGGGTAEMTSYRMLQAATTLVSSALIVLMVGSPSALRLSRAQQTNAKWCEDVAATSTLFHNGVMVLQVCAVVNTILITVAWLLVALQCSMTMSSSTSNRSRIVELQEALGDKEKRLYKLQGTYLESSSAEELKSLIQLHQRAIELTEGVLVSKLQALHRPTAAV